MRNRGQLFFGLILVVFGLLSLFSILFRINFGALCFPIALIALGAWIVFRPPLSSLGLSSKDMASDVSLLGDRRRRGNWTVRNEEFWMGVGDIELDLTQAVIFPGETIIRINTFVSDIDIYLPKSVGVTIRVNGFVSETDLLGQDQQSFLFPVEVSSPDYSAAECRLKIEMNGFVSNLKVKQLVS